MKPNIKQRNMLKGRLEEGRKRLKHRMKASKNSTNKPTTTEA
jgi:hypothetical protein